ncbi:MAG: 2-C-methyl-D-erythritol 4-phosphate cytidylyltransferase [Verrucomicrobia bacterium ADurb.Bin345]|nr:MAG: 2-C-methyl-D-erythritol 4-phosphate cytidylyltransferase [Verrucomicrobia bacterium ADurb.Bin345]
MIHVTWGLVVACGRTEQISTEVDTPFLNLGSRPVLAYSLAAFEQCPDINGVVVVVDKTRLDTVLGMSQMYGFAKVQKIVPGGVTRQTSVASALKALDEEVSIVCIHDAARPCVTPHLISETVKAAKRYGSGVSAVPLSDAVKVVEKGLTISESINGGTAWLAQTPQAFRRDLLEKGYTMASKKKVSVEDDSSAVALTREEVHLVEGPSENIKIRSPVDFTIAATMLKVS